MGLRPTQRYQIVITCPVPGNAPKHHHTTTLPIALLASAVSHALARG